MIGRGAPGCDPSVGPLRRRFSRAFTLLEVMIAVGVLGIAMLALLALHHQSLQSVIHAQDLSRAAMLAQTLMTETEMQRWPNVGTSSGNFEQFYPKMYPRYRWQRAVAGSDSFPDIRKVEVDVLYGPRFQDMFSLTELIHNPEPQPIPNQQGTSSDQSPAGVAPGLNDIQ